MRAASALAFAFQGKRRNQKIFSETGVGTRKTPGGHDASSTKKKNYIIVIIRVVSIYSNVTYRPGEGP